MLYDYHNSSLHRRCGLCVGPMNTDRELVYPGCVNPPTGYLIPRMRCPPFSQGFSSRRSQRRCNGQGFNERACQTPSSLRTGRPFLFLLMSQASRLPFLYKYSDAGISPGFQVDFRNVGYSAEKQSTGVPPCTTCDWPAPSELSLPP